MLSCVCSLDCGERDRFEWEQKDCCCMMDRIFNSSCDMDDACKLWIYVFAPSLLLEYVFDVLFFILFFWSML